MNVWLLVKRNRHSSHPALSVDADVVCKRAALGSVFDLLIQLVVGTTVGHPAVQLARVLHEDCQKHEARVCFR